MDVREVGDKRLILLRNPWGAQSPRSWNGDWSRDSAKWTDELKRELGVVNSAGVSMYDSNAMFWMSWEDVVEYFASLEICRVHEDYPSEAIVRQRCWLPALTGLGEMFTVTAPDNEDASVDITVYQESNKTRESAVGMASTLVDIGLVILRVDPVTGELLECAGTAKRDMMPEVSTEMFLKRGQTYRIVPLSFSHSMELGHRKSTVAIHSSQKLTNITPSKRMDGIESGSATFAYATVYGKRRDVAPGIGVYICQDSSGTIVCGENTRQDCSFVIELDASDSKNVVSSRGSLTTQDTIPPMTRAVLMTLSPEKNATKFQLSLAMAHGIQPGDGGGGVLFPPPADATMHVLLPIKPSQPTPNPQQQQQSGPSSISTSSTQERIKSLFDEYVAAGLSPNEALLAALAAVREKRNDN